jgi:hypothetical protein
VIRWNISGDGILTIWRNDVEIVKVFIPAKQRAEMILDLVKSLK